MHDMLLYHFPFVLKMRMNRLSGVASIRTSNVNAKETWGRFYFIINNVMTMVYVNTSTMNERDFSKITASRSPPGSTSKLNNTENKMKIQWNVEERMDNIYWDPISIWTAFSDNLVRRKHQSKILQSMRVAVFIKSKNVIYWWRNNDNLNDTKCAIKKIIISIINYLKEFFKTS